jgi:hypothetical protein
MDKIAHSLHSPVYDVAQRVEELTMDNHGHNVLAGLYLRSTKLTEEDAFKLKDCLDREEGTAVIKFVVIPWKEGPTDPRRTKFYGPGKHIAKV